MPAVGAIGEQVIGDRTGLLIDNPRDLIGFGRAVRRLLDDDRLSRRIAQGGFGRCTRRFLIDRQLTECALFYAELITRQRGGDV